eukprot:CAMPEP_0114308954 /NCGR_PEP_ID=MMETSP0059-20121206/18367_1 /TAXON_ID=36894 /ORGANISM="Pyramimonas parkeae, Strain CCMP726" /LENGTH=50 /DNA_ID=CAMNT_0001432697 /DNA_START=593 /DNA_END=745 /DNA_ORIENTATION=-
MTAAAAGSPAAHFSADWQASMRPCFPSRKPSLAAAWLSGYPSHPLAAGGQ